MGSSRDAIAAFKGELDRARMPATVRLTRGRDIAAACGQLATSPRPRSAVAARLDSPCESRSACRNHRQPALGWSRRSDRRVAPRPVQRPPTRRQVPPQLEGAGFRHHGGERHHLPDHPRLGGSVTTPDVGTYSAPPGLLREHRPDRVGAGDRPVVCLFQLASFGCTIGLCGYVREGGSAAQVRLLRSLLCWWCRQPARLHRGVTG